MLEFVAFNCVIAFNTLPTKGAAQDTHFLVIWKWKTTVCIRDKQCSKEKNIGCYFQGKWSLRNELENSILINSLNKHVENLWFKKFAHFLHNFTETICWREYLQKVNCHIITLCQLYLGVSNRNVVSYQLRKMQKSKFTFICYNAFKLRKSFCRGIFSN